MPAALTAQQEMHIRVLQQLAYSGLLEDCGRPILLPGKRPGAHNEATCSGRMTVEGQAFWLRVRLPWEFPLCLPIVSVERKESEAVLPHFINDDEVCFASDVGLLDRRQPEAILHESLERVRTLLRDMLRGDRGGSSSGRSRPTGPPSQEDAGSTALSPRTTARASSRPCIGERGCRRWRMAPTPMHAHCQTGGPKA